MKKTNSFLIFLILFFNNCVSQKNNELLFIEKQISKFYLNEHFEERLDESENFITIYSIHHNIIDSTKIEDGIYKSFNQLNSNFNFFIYENKVIDVLELSTIDDLTKSVKKLIEYSIKHKYCNDITKDYIRRMMYFHYIINNNRKRQDLNCEYDKVSIKSIFKYKEINSKLIQFLIDNKQTLNNNVFDNTNETLVFKKLDMYYGLPDEDENLDIGIYLFLNSEKELKPNYIIINENNYEIINISESVVNLAEKAIVFGEKNSLCHEKTYLIISDIIDFSMNTNCSNTFVIGNKKIDGNSTD